MNNETLARDFMDWYAANMDKLKRYVKDYDDDLFSDAFLRAYNAILRRGTIVKDYTGYFLQTYRATFLDSHKVAGLHTEDINDGVHQIAEEEPEDDEYDQAVIVLNAEVIDYVRANYDALSVLLFQIYVRLYPKFPYSKIAKQTGLSEPRIKQRVGPIKKDVAAKFGQRRGFLLV